MLLILLLLTGSLNIPVGKNPPTGPGKVMLSSPRQNRLRAPGQVIYPECPQSHPAPGAFSGLTRGLLQGPSVLNVGLTVIMGPQGSPSLS